MSVESGPPSSCRHCRAAQRQEQMHNSSWWPQVRQVWMFNPITISKGTNKFTRAILHTTLRARARNCFCVRSSMLGFIARPHSLLEICHQSEDRVMPGSRLLSFPVLLWRRNLTATATHVPAGCCSLASEPAEFEHAWLPSAATPSENHLVE